MIVQRAQYFLEDLL